MCNGLYRGRSNGNKYLSELIWLFFIFDNKGGFLMIHEIAAPIARINLTSRKITVEELDEDILKKYLGGRGVASYMLYREVSKNVAPLEDGNKIFIFVGPLAATPLPAVSRAIATFKSPLTGVFAEASSGGHWPTGLRKAGFSGLIIEGRSEEPVYVVIRDRTVEFKPANHLWGCGCWETEDVIKTELNDSAVNVASIGPAGENKVKYACVTNEKARQFGRCGMGAVMGAKNLKAIAVIGTGVSYVKDMDGVLELRRKMFGLLKENPLAGRSLRPYGTPNMLNITSGHGVVPTNNGRQSYFEDYQKINPGGFKPHFVTHRACSGCFIRCSKVNAFKDIDSSKESYIEGPEYETIYSYGTMCGIADPLTILQANYLCDDLGLDTLTAGVTIAFAMECREKGMLDELDGENLVPVFGDRKGVLKLTKAIAHRRGIGDLLAEGSNKTSLVIGKGSEKLLVTGKGLEIPGYDPRGLKGTGLAYATSSRGACHMNHHIQTVELHGMWRGRPIDRETYDNKAGLVKWLQDFTTFTDCLVTCRFLRPLADDYNIYLEMLKLACGYEISPDEAGLIGERVFNLERLYNVREGMGRQNDSLSYRITCEPITNGPSKGSTLDLDLMIDEYYSLRGWNSDGIPEKETIIRLELEDVLYSNK